MGPKSVYRSDQFFSKGPTDFISQKNLIGSGSPLLGPKKFLMDITEPATKLQV